ncbi:MAG TPA: glycine betaine ABC transporter substrate-binding protein [Gammaproteobacteria bacterium]|nr:glycine betaine ABC transporter substrate-binding protein [Gammaproteobacteria bacterium]
MPLRTKKPRAALLPLLATALVAWGLLPASGPAQSPSSVRGSVVVGSKTFPESYLLAEIMAQLLESRGWRVERRFGFGGTLLCYEALVAGDLDVYPEYSGTIDETILKRAPSRDRAAFPSPEVRADLAALGLETLAPFGFDDTYALTVGPETAKALSLARISDLAAHPELRFGLSHEFLSRADGWPGLKSAYDLPQTAFGIDHALAYRALAGGKLDVTDAYSTDGDLAEYGLVVLEDDRAYFPEYRALPLVRTGLDAAAKADLDRLAGRIDEARMIALNAEVAVDGRGVADVAAEFLRAQGLVAAHGPERSGVWRRLGRNTLIHLKLTGIAVAAASVLGVALALAVYRSALLSSAVLQLAGLLQTIPSIALLALLIPLAGVGQLPAVIALFLYSLLPIVRSTVTALITVDPLLRKVAAALGLTHREQLRHVFLPLALPQMLSGLRLAAVISIGTATLAAFIGAGGLGEPIVTGLALNDTGLILQGALPAAGLAILVELGFEWLERRLVPRHLVMRRLGP